MSVSAPNLTRPGLFAMMQAYKNTSVLRSGIELGVFDLLVERATAEQVAASVGADSRGIRILLNALAALRLVRTDGQQFWLAEGVEQLLVRSRSEYAGDMIRVFASDWEWDALKRLSEAVRSGGTVMDAHAETPEYRYWEDFARYAPVVAQPTAEVLAGALEPWALARPTLDVLDVAAGHGVYGFTVAQRFRNARVWALDWKNVLQVTLEQANRFGVRDRTRFIAGDMFEVALGGPYDLVLVTNVLHHFAEERAIALLRRAASVLKPDGRLGLVGFTTSDALPEQDPAPHLFSVLMLAWTSHGEVHSRQTYLRMLAASGFDDVAMHGVPELPFHVILAARGGSA